MGVVYRAQDTRLDRTVAIKFLPQQLSSSAETKERFLREAKAAAAQNHPNIMGVHEINEHEGALFLVMEYLEGETLKKHLGSLKSGSGIPVQKALDWAVEVGKGLRAAHDKQIVHRDIKPENIMITADGRIKIMDFGVAKLSHTQGLTKTGSSMGTLSYMAPEQAQARAKKLADGLRQVKGLVVDAGSPSTNMVYLNLADDVKVDSWRIVERAKKAGVLLDAENARRFRLVTHYWVDDVGEEKTVSAFREALG